MKKHFAIILMAAALVACTGIEQPELMENPDAPKTYTMTVKASKTVDTKALSLSGNTLNATWTEDDEVNVYNSSSQLLGTLQAKEVSLDGASCTLKGKLDTAPSDGETLTLKYHSNSYTGQDGTLAYIASNCDYAVASVTVNVDNTTHNVTTSSPASFINQQAIAKFTLVDKANSTTENPTKLSPSVLNATVSYMGMPLRNYSFDVPDATYTTNGAGVIFLAIPSDIPASVQIGENTFPTDPTKISFTLSATVGSETYIYSRTGFPFENGKYYEITVKMRPEGTVNGLFTVNDSGKKVYFSKGNLQAVFSEAGSMIDKPSICTWKFADNQLIYVGNSAANTSIDGYGHVSAAGTVDLFGRSAFDANNEEELKANAYGICNVVSSTDVNWRRYYGSQNVSNVVDWGTVFGASSPWRTLTKDEWIWLLGPVYNGALLDPGFNCRVTSTVNEVENARFAPLKVDNYYGIIIFPDTFTYPSEVTTPINNINKKEVTWSKITSLTASDWAALEAAGAVFLTIGGRRDNSRTDPILDYPGYDYNARQGYYWAGNAIGAYISFGGEVHNEFGSWVLNNDAGCKEYFGQSVRLVRNAN